MGSSSQPVHPWESPIGVMDSGVGGLTVVKALRRHLPFESIDYFGDTARVPYGEKSAATIRTFTRHCADFLVRRGIKLLVIACNTATAHALSWLSEELPIPVVGVIDPTVGAACTISVTGRIGVIATRQTIASGVYQKTILRQRPESKIWAHACPLFVPLAEEQYWDHPATKTIVADYLRPLKEQGCDTLVLGCTHYPLLMDAIQEVVGPTVQLIDSATSCAREVERALRIGRILAPEGTPSRLTCFVSDDPERFALLGARFLGEPLSQVAHVIDDGYGQYRH